MACIGAVFCSEDPDAVFHSKVFSDICIQSLARLVSFSKLYLPMPMFVSCLTDFYHVGSRRQCKLS
jgi:hypothetical protein